MYASPVRWSSTGLPPLPTPLWSTRWSQLIFHYYIRYVQSPWCDWISPCPGGIACPAIPCPGAIARPMRRVLPMLNACRSQYPTHRSPRADQALRLMKLWSCPCPAISVFSARGTSCNLSLAASWPQLNLDRLYGLCQLLDTQRLTLVYDFLLPLRMPTKGRWLGDPNRRF